MFLSPDEKKKEINPEKLKKDMIHLREEVDLALKSLDTDREAFDNWIKTGSGINFYDHHLINKELEDFEKSMDLACFCEEEDGLKRKREELKEKSAAQSRHNFKF